MADAHILHTPTPSLFLDETGDKSERQGTVCSWRGAEVTAVASRFEI